MRRAKVWLMWLIEAIFSKEFSMCVRIRNV